MKKIVKNIIIVITLLFMIVTTGCTTDENNEKVIIEAPTISLDNNIISWDLITNATSYNIYLDDVFLININENTYTINQTQNGTYTYKIKAVAENQEDTSSLISEFSNSVIYIKNITTKLSSPVISLNGDVVSWDNVTNSNHYDIYINETLKASIQTNSYKITETAVGNYNIYVIAKSNNTNYQNSNNSNIVTYEVKEKTLYSSVLEASQGNTGSHFIVKGTVIAVNERALLVKDDTATIQIYLGTSHSFLIGDIVEVDGTITSYGGVNQFANTSKVTKVGTTTYLHPVSNAYDGVALDNYLSNITVGNYVSIKGTLNINSSYYNLIIENINTFSVSLTYPLSNLNLSSLNNKEILIEGYLTGVTSNKYICLMVTTVKSLSIDTTEIYFELPNNWQNAYLYWWDSSIKIDWPGKAMTLVKDNLYKFDLPIDTNKVIFNNGNSTMQTENLIFDKANPLFIINDINSDNKYSGTWTTLEHKSVNFLVINDTHGTLVDDSGKGMARVETIINNLESTNGDYIKIANGDIFQGSYVTSILYGLPMIDTLNAMNFDCFVLGNHEFDWGLEVIHKYKDNDLTNGEANFPFLGANIVYKGTTTRVNWLDPYTIIESNGKKIGVIGIMGYGLESSILAENVKDYTFLDPVNIVSDLASELRTQKNCDIVVVSAHDYNTSTNASLASLKNEARIDAIFCAHTHEYINETIKRSDNKYIPVLQTNGYNSSVWSLMMDFDEDNDIVYNAQNYRPANYVADEKINTIINKYKDTIDEGNRVIGYTSSSMDREELGLIAANAMQERFDVDYSVLNTGGVRSTISAGNITVADVFEVFPFQNIVITINIKGVNLKSLYENNSRYLYFNSSFSSSSLNNTSEYGLAVIDYVYTGTYYTQFNNTIPTNTNILLRDVVIDYINNNY